MTVRTSRSVYEFEHADFIAKRASYPFGGQRLSQGVGRAWAGGARAARHRAA